MEIRRFVRFFLIAVVISTVIAYFTRVTWIMTLDFALFMLLREMLTNKSKTKEENEDKIGKVFAGPILVLATVCIYMHNGWLLLHYGVPALLGLVLPAEDEPAKQDS
jgi:hypothetical protein